MLAVLRPVVNLERGGQQNRPQIWDSLPSAASIGTTRDPGTLEA
jgi:hypothetical protein